MVIYDNEFERKEKKRKFKPRVKLTPNIDIQICVTLSLSLFSDARMKDLRFVWSLLMCELF